MLFAQGINLTCRKNSPDAHYLPTMLPAPYWQSVAPSPLLKANERDELACQVVLPMMLALCCAKPHSNRDLNSRACLDVHTACHLDWYRKEEG